MAKKYTLIVITAILVLQCTITAYSQDTPNPFLTADSLKSGNYKDVLTSFFQLAFNNLTGPAKELKFSSDPFAIMARGNPELYNGRNWYKYRYLRRFNFNVTLKADSNYHLNSFSGGIKYALINKRDLTTSKAFFRSAAASDETKSWHELNVSLSKIQESISIDLPLRSRFREAANKLTAQDSTKLPFKDLPEDVRDYIVDYIDKLPDSLKPDYKYLRTLIEHPDVNPYERVLNDYNLLRDEFLKKPLWTISAEGSSYTDQVVFANATFSSQFLAGIGNNAQRTFTYEADLKAQYSLKDDSLVAGRDLERQVFSFEPGINFVLRTKKEYKSYLEFKLSGSYYHIFPTLHPAEKSDSLTLNAEIRLRVYDDIWVPIVLKYDPEHGNVFGFLNISANFTGLAGLLHKKED
jgi:hypothetical protein